MAAIKTMFILFLLFISIYLIVSYFIHIMYKSVSEWKKISYKKFKKIIQEKEIKITEEGYITEGYIVFGNKNILYMKSNIVKIRIIDSKGIKYLYLIFNPIDFIRYKLLFFFKIELKNIFIIFKEINQYNKKNKSSINIEEIMKEGK